MANIYDQHTAAFNRVSAYVVLRNGERVATVAFKFPADGAGRLYAYVHWIGTEMTRGSASGYGYDKRSAACANAVSKRVWAADDEPALWFARALATDGGSEWDRRLRDAGFVVLQAM